MKLNIVGGNSVSLLTIVIALFIFSIVTILISIILFWKAREFTKDDLQRLCGSIILFISSGLFLFLYREDTLNSFLDILTFMFQNM